ncbi:hypothetical protein NC651_030694 [Populus alba x Populus x berolinensis]|nr:hypothetical protein NC651_030694 [Populus alba x Populus x berolinensis]
MLFLLLFSLPYTPLSLYFCSPFIFFLLSFSLFLSPSPLLSFLSVLFSPMGSVFFCCFYRSEKALCW